ncbi:glycoside hydrolase family 5 protein [Paenibacillus herberti]|uniref:Glycoside hydrolase n=1 Tax=Paenibacillus herberti TaxID=1619309 RepID=A0A229NVP7_9BACL|nr:cellulase family glycosylhydrolase [Paenibacillus herberti]OXM14013.1 glycoside hydrolase [Paenibacillus herberti]
MKSQLYRQPEVDGWVKAEGKRLVNGRGEELILRGVGLGSWLLPEGYMWKLPAEGDRPRRIERMVTELIGERNAATFWQTYFNRYTSEADIRQLSLEGFNSVRVPFNARKLLEGELNEEGYNPDQLELLDRVIDWCRTWGVYVILDMHGAPGGQTGANIDDSENDQPELFTSAEHRQAAIDLWRYLAQRYRDEWIVAGYDLLNEPLPDYHGKYKDWLEPLYRDMIATIREVDERHLIILEGAHWSTDWTVFTEKLDDNVLYQFHKYWNNPDTESIQKYLDFRNAWNVPIFMGEGGENDLDWYAGAFRLFEDHRISWNFWTWKKIDTINSPCSIPKPEGWEKLGNWLEGGNKPEPEEACRILGRYLDGMLFDACDYRSEVVNALLRRAPMRIPAIHYGYKGEGESFGFKDSERDQITWQSDYRRGDGLAIRKLDGEPMLPRTEPGWHRWDVGDGLCVELPEGGWLAYEFTIAAEAVASVLAETAATSVEITKASIETTSAKPSAPTPFSLKLRLMAAGEEAKTGAALELELDGVPLGQLPADSTWSSAVLSDPLPLLAPGLHRLVLTAIGGALLLESVELDRS